MQGSPAANSAAALEQVPPFSIQKQNQSTEVQPLYQVLTDEWFRQTFEQLYFALDDFVGHFFSRFKDIPADNSSSPWIEMSTEFCRYSTAVAEPDKSLGDWNRILLNTKERHYLLMGILARVLEAKIFGELLFGGSKVQKKQLEELEIATVEVEGFGRTRNRAHNILSILNSGLPPNLDLDVARLSKQIMLLLQPVSKFLHSAAQYGRDPQPTDEDMFRHIHMLVNATARVSYSIRTSPTIIYFYFERPGNLFDPTEQTDNDYSSYAESKSAVIKDVSETRRHRALVRFVLWPSIKRYTAGTSDRPGQSAAGFRVYNVTNSQVVYYWGLEDDAQKVQMSLPTFIEQQKRKRRSRVYNAANDVTITMGTLAGRMIARSSVFHIAVILAVSICLIMRDLMQGRDPFGWQ